MVKNKAVWEEFRSAVKRLGIEVSDESAELERLSHDASLFEVRPQLAIYPRSSKDIQRLVSSAAQHKAALPRLSITVRSGGTDMGGGAINDSLIIDVARHLNGLGELKGQSITAQPGVYYRDLDGRTRAKNMLLPSYPASRELCTIGGMVANDAGGEKSLRYGKTHRYVTSLKMVLRDGQEYTFKPLGKGELAKLLQTKTLQSDIYRQLYALASHNQKLIQKSRPQVSKNSTGYNLWEVWDGEIFDPTKVIVGSQGTLGVITEVTFGLVPTQPLSGMIVAFLPSMKNLGKIINAALELQPTSLESFDEHTLKFAFRFFLTFRKTLGWKRFILLGLSFIPVLGKLIEMMPSLPKLILMAEFEGSAQADIETKMEQLGKKLKIYDITVQRAKDRRHEEKFWTIRRESFNLLRKNIKNKHTAPFIDDIIVAPKHLPEFLPRLEAILIKHRLFYTVAGHMGDGNFHIIPLMDLTNPAERQKIYPVLQEVSKLVLEYGGSLSGEHNDGLIRGPLLGEMYGPEMLNLFKQVKNIFDPGNLFNPHKKTDATLGFSQAHIRGHF